MPDVITCTSEGDDLSGRRCQGVSRPDDAPAVRRNGAGPVQGSRDLPAGRNGRAHLACRRNAE